MHGRSGTGQVVDALDLDFERIDHVMPHQFEIWVIQQMSDVFSSSCEKVVHAQDFFTLRKQTLAQMTPKKSCASCY
jgi:hypothetical protein